MSRSSPLAVGQVRRLHDYYFVATQGMHAGLSWQGNWNVPNSRGQNAFRERSERAAASAQFTSVGCRSVSCSTAEVCWRRERGARDASAGSPQCSLLRSRAAAHHHADRQRDNSGRANGTTGQAGSSVRQSVHCSGAVPRTFRTAWARTRSSNVPNTHHLSFLPA